VINTCSVTHVADRKARHLVREARRLSPGAQIILTGCYAETAPADAAALAGAGLVLGNAGKRSIPARVLERLARSGDPASGCPTHIGSGLRTRAFIRIQKGCNELCAFCIVPYTRGREISTPVERVVAQVREREEEGVQEVVLTGTQLGNYGRDLGWGEQGPRRLLEALLKRTSVARIRLSSLQAQDISPQLVALWGDRRLCPHFHIPLQSGSDVVLQAMRRRYTAAAYMKAVELIRGRVPDVAITTDAIAGFPGETTADFKATLRVCREARFAAIHAFPYSRRPHTGAALMPGHLPAAVRRERLERLLSIGQESFRAFRRRFLGRTLEVLWEEDGPHGWHGLTANYIRVHAASTGEDLSNRLRPVRLLRLDGDRVVGETIGETAVA
jgi:threonylcarbamoyladenosine tRNA methylthiotransferase MtaB